MSLTIEKCIEGWTNTIRQLNLKADIAFFGDSLTFWGNFAPLFPSKIVYNLGLRGDTIGGMIERIEQLRCIRPDVVFLMVGINDISTSCYASFERDYLTLIDLICKVESKPKLYLQSIPPVNEKSFGPISVSNIQVERANNIIKAFANNRDLIFLDLFSLYQSNGELPAELSKDGIHLKSEAYEIWYYSIFDIYRQ